MKNNKKTQIGVFVLMGLVIIIGLGFAFYLRNSPIKQAEIEKISKISFDLNPIKSYIQNCIKNSGQYALIHIGKQGGYYELKKPYLKDENFDLPY